MKESGPKKPEMTSDRKTERLDYLLVSLGDTNERRTEGGTTTSTALVLRRFAGTNRRLPQQDWRNDQRLAFQVSFKAPSRSPRTNVHDFVKCPRKLQVARDGTYANNDTSFRDTPAPSQRAPQLHNALDKCTRSMRNSVGSEAPVRSSFVGSSPFTVMIRSPQRTSADYEIGGK